MTHFRERGNIVPIVIIAVLVVAVAAVLLWPEINARLNPNVDVPNPNLNVDVPNPDLVGDESVLDNALEEEEEGANQQVSVENVLDNPNQYAGQTVTLTAEIEEKLTPRAFVLDGPAIADQGLLVVTRTATTLPAEENDLLADAAAVRVTGTVRIFTVALLEEETGIVLEPEDVAAFANAPFIVATSIERIPADQE